jgi:hypothetical protein
MLKDRIVRTIVLGDFRAEDAEEEREELFHAISLFDKSLQKLQESSQL